MLATHGEADVPFRVLTYPPGGHDLPGAGPMAVMQSAAAVDQVFWTAVKVFKRQRWIDWLAKHDGNVSAAAHSAGVVARMPPKF